MAIERLALLSGWAFSAEVLAPLQAALHRRQPAVQVEVLSLPALADPSQWLDWLDGRLPRTCALGGWSLGGMLAVQLAARRGADCPALLTLNANACFSARADWPQAMDPVVLNGFVEAFAARPLPTLKRFAQLSAQGAAAPRELGRTLLGALLPADQTGLGAGLQLLERLDNRSLLQTLKIPQLHLLSRQDAVVPVATADALQVLNPGSRVRIHPQAGHGLPLEDPDWIAVLWAELAGGIA